MNYIEVRVKATKVKYTNGEKVFEKIIPYRIKKQELKQTFADPNGYTIIEMRSTTEIWELSYDELLNSGTWLKTIDNKTPIIYS